MTELNIDIETFGTRPLKGTKAVGTYKYVEDPKFGVMLFAYSFDNDPVRVLDLLSGDLIPQAVLDALVDPAVLKTAHNANFELTCLNKYMWGNYDLKLDHRQWECTMVRCAMLGLPLALENVAKVLGLTDLKDSRGKALITYFCQPCKPTKTNGQRTRNYPFHDPEKWAEFIEYNRQDVVVEKAIRNKTAFFKMPAFERELWYMDQDINNRGCMIDVTLVKNAIQINLENNDELMNTVTERTGVINPNSDAQLKEWLMSNDVDMPDMQKDTVKAMLSGDHVAIDVRKVLELRQQFKKSSIKKYDALLRALGADSRIRGIIQFYGANRTGRYAGRIFQPQNLPRISLKSGCLDIARELVKKYDVDGIRLMFGNIANTLSQLIRTAVIPAPGHEFIISDFSAIEARVIAWLAGEKWRLDVFATHGMIYEASASKMFGIALELCGEGTVWRQRGKVAELALGFQGGVGALIKMGALDMGISEQELDPIVKAWRKENPNIVKLWYKVDELVVEAVRTGKKVALPKGMFAEVRESILFIKLPSGRELAYYKPELYVNKFDRLAVRYQGLDQETKQWRRIETYGGKLVENIVQAIARDCLVFAKYNLWKAGYDTVLHIHDEVVLESLIGMGSTKEVDKIMSRTPDWGEGLPLTAKSYISMYYKKD